MLIKEIGVLGAGTWGMALAHALVKVGHRVMVWSALPEEIDNLENTRRHPNLPKMEIGEDMGFTKNIEEAVKGKDIVLFAVPSVFIRNTAKEASEFMSDEQVVVTVAKGIETDTLMTMGDIIKEELGKKGLSEVKIVALSGPTHAEEVALDMPTAIVSSSEDPNAAKMIQDVFMSEALRVYTGSDIEGAELCGAMKNVIALAVGVSSGLGYGDNAKAALITRGMKEIFELGSAMGCNEKTFYGLTGIGDLIVTATSEHSRNNRCGKLIGKGMTPEDAVKEVGMVVEGLNALPAMLALGDKYKVRIPIARMLDDIVSGRRTPSQAAAELMLQGRKSEY